MAKRVIKGGGGRSSPPPAGEPVRGSPPSASEPVRGSPLPAGEPVRGSPPPAGESVRDSPLPNGEVGRSVPSPAGKPRLSSGATSSSQNLSRSAAAMKQQAATIPASKEGIIQRHSPLTGMEKAVTRPVKGTARYTGQKAHEKFHTAVSMSEQDNAALETAHKAERIGEIALQKGTRYGVKKGIKIVKSVPTAINKRIAAKATAPTPPAKKALTLSQGGTGRFQVTKRPKKQVSLSQGSAGRFRVSAPPHGGLKNIPIASRSIMKIKPTQTNVRRLKMAASRPPPPPPRGLALAKHTWHTPSAQLGSMVDHAPKRPGFINKELHKGLATGKRGLQFGGGQAAIKMRGKLAQESGDNSSVKAAGEAVQLAERPTKYVLNKGTKLAVKPVKKVSNKMRSAIRHKLLIRKQMFLAKHQGIAAARGAAMKIRAIVKAIMRELLKMSAPLIKWGLILVGVYLICTMVIGPIVAALTQAGTSYVLTTTYPVAAGDITNSVEHWTQLEMELDNRINNIRSEYPGYDEYRFDIDPMEFDPIQLISYLAAMHLEFTHEQVQAEIAALFGEVNPLQLVPKTETRYDSDGEPYTYRILNVILKPKPFEEAVTPRLEAAGSKDLYEIYMGTGGNQQAFGNPFAFDWRGNVSCNYGYRVNPTRPSSGYEFHTGLDIKAAAGTPIRSVQHGFVVVSGWHDLYGNYMVIRNESGISTLYAHCTELLAGEGQEVQQGQIIATVGTTGNSTGNHLHIEVKLEDVRVDPIFYIKSYDE